MTREYGQTKTHLTLTKKAQNYYDGASPFSIYEHDDGGVLTYSFKAFGDPETTRMTEAELIECLESMADEE